MLVAAALASTLAITSTAAKAGTDDPPSSSNGVMTASVAAGIGIAVGTCTLVGGSVNLARENAAGWRVANFVVTVFDVAVGGAAVVVGRNDVTPKAPTAYTLGGVAIAVGALNLAIGIASAARPAGSPKPAVEPIVEVTPRSSPRPATAPAAPQSPFAEPPASEPPVAPGGPAIVPAEPPPRAAPLSALPASAPEQRARFSWVPLFAPGRHGELTAGVALQWAAW